MSIDEELLEILVCPESKAELVFVDEYLVSTDPETRRRYVVEDGIPRMLVEESEQLDEGEWKDLMKKAGRDV